MALSKTNSTLTAVDSAGSMGAMHGDNPLSLFCPIAVKPEHAKQCSSKHMQEDACM